MRTKNRTQMEFRREVANEEGLEKQGEEKNAGKGVIKKENEK